MQVKLCELVKVSPRCKEHSVSYNKYRYLQAIIHNTILCIY